MMFVFIALILSTSLVLGDFQHDFFTEDCKNATLNLDSFPEDKLSKNYITSPSLKCISITFDYIAKIEEGAFDSVPNLMHLNFERNYIEPRNMFSFGSLPKVRSLIHRRRAKNLLTFVNDTSDLRSFGNDNDIAIITTVYPELLYLDLSNDLIGNIQTYVPNPFPKLTYLDLSNNQLSLFDLKLCSNTLMYLNLHNNRISKISHKELKNLISFTVDDNAISSVGKNYDLDLSGLSSLEYLSIANNKINVIDVTAFVDTVNLRYLNMSQNNLTALEPELFAPLTSLEVIMLDNNMFHTVPLMELLNVTTLSMNCNRITHLTPSSLSRLPNLRKLYLARNMISNIHVDTFKSQELLEELYLNDNELNDLPVHWDLHTKNLRYLDLSGNKLISIAPFLSTTNIALEQVYLDDNPLKYVDLNTSANNKTMPKIMTNLNIGQKRSKPVCGRKYKFVFADSTLTRFL